MTRRGHWTRRRVLAASLGAIAGAAVGSRGSALATPAVIKGSKLTYWGGLIFSDNANKLLVDTINKWGADNGVETDVVMINQNETVQKVSAAVASNTLPDAFDLNLDLLLLLSRQGVFLPVDDLFDAIGKAQGGWFAPVANATDTSKVAGGQTGIPFGVSGNLLLRRNDVLTEAGFAKPPATWEELVEQAAAVNKPPLFGLGLALSNVGDGNVQIAVMQSYGGRIADDTGTKAAIKSDATRTLPDMGEGRLGQEALPARQHHLGRRRRQPGLPRRTGRVHRQHRIGRHRGEGAGSRALRGHPLIRRCPAAHRASSRRSRRTCGPCPRRARTPMPPRR